MIIAPRLAFTQVNSRPLVEVLAAVQPERSLDDGGWMLVIGAVVVALSTIGILLLLLIRGKNAHRIANEIARAERDANLQLRSIANTANLVLAKYNNEGQLVYISPGIRRLTGISAAQFVAGHIALSDVVHPEDLVQLRRAERYREEEHLDEIEIDYRVTDQKGRWHWLHVRQTPVIIQDKLRGFTTIAVDFTDHVRFSQQQHKLLHLRELNTDILQSFLATADTALTTQQTLERVRTFFQLATATLFEREGDNEHFTRTYSSDDGTRSDEDHGTETMTADQTNWWLDRLETGQPLAIVANQCTDEDRNAVAQLLGPSPKTVLMIPALVMGDLRLLVVLESKDDHQEWKPEELDALQTVTYAVARSIERNQAESDKADFEETRRRHERSEIIAHLASGIAHDFNNIVFAVSGRIQLLRKHANDERTKNSLDEILQTLQSAKGIIGALLAMHRGAGPRAGRVRLGPEVHALAMMIQRLIPKRITFTIDNRLSASTEVQLTAEALQQILMNLVVNARDATESGGQITVTLQEAPDDHSSILMHIDDDGPGIPEDQRSSVFQAFFTTKDPARGTGLGLSIVQRVVREHGGTVVLSDSPLGGLRVTTSFQRSAPQESNQPEVSDNSPQIETRIERVLIVEDDTIIRDMLVRSFEALNVQVVDQSNALGVPQLLTDPDNPIDILVMDIDLPHKTGVECLTELRTAGIETPCVLITGGLAELPDTLSSTQLLRKPFPIEALERTCRELLARNNPDHSD